MDLGKRRFGGTFAWLLWMFVHVMQLVSFRNRFMVLMNWAWKYARLEEHHPVDRPSLRAAQRNTDTARRMAHHAAAARCRWSSSSRSSSTCWAGLVIPSCPASHP